MSSTSQNCGNCQPVNVSSQPVSQDDLNSAASNILNALGVQACNYTQNISQAGSSTLSAAGVVVSPFAIGGVAATETTVGGTTTNTSSIGCEQVAVTALSYVQTKESIVQTLNCSCTTIDQSSTAVNSITIEAHDNSKILCNITVDQSINLNTIISSQISSNTISQIQSLTTNYLTSSVNSLLNTNTQAGSTPTGSKSVTDVVNEINSTEISNQINQTIVNMLQSVSGTNNITIKLYNSILSGTQCTFTQNIILDLVATNILSSAMNIAYNTSTFQQAFNATSTSTTTTSTGIAAITDSIGNALSKINSALGVHLSTSSWLIIFIVFILIFLGIMFFLNKTMFVVILVIVIVITIVCIILKYK